MWAPQSVIVISQYVWKIHIQSKPTTLEEYGQTFSVSAKPGQLNKSLHKQKHTDFTVLVDVPFLVFTSPWYITNQTLHSDLHIPYVHTVMKDYIHKHRTALESHPNPLVEPLTHTTHTRRLKRHWTFDEIKWVEVTGLTPGSTTQPTAH